MLGDLFADDSLYLLARILIIAPINDTIDPAPVWTLCHLITRLAIHLSARILSSTLDQLVDLPEIGEGASNLNMAADGGAYGSRSRKDAVDSNANTTASTLSDAASWLDHALLARIQEQSGAHKRSDVIGVLRWAVTGRKVSGWARIRAVSRNEWEMRMSAVVGVQRLAVREGILSIGRSARNLADCGAAQLGRRRTRQQLVLGWFLGWQNIRSPTYQSLVSMAGLVEWNPGGKGSQN